jgi:hypothetical protein
MRCLSSHPFSRRYVSPCTNGDPTAQGSVSDCSTSRITCDVPSAAAFCSQSIECFPGVATQFFLKPFVTIPVAPVITGIIIIIIILLLLLLLQYNILLIIINVVVAKSL